MDFDPKEPSQGTDDSFDPGQIIQSNPNQVEQNSTQDIPSVRDGADIFNKGGRDNTPDGGNDSNSGFSSDNE